MGVRKWASLVILLLILVGAICQNVRFVRLHTLLPTADEHVHVGMALYAWQYLHQHGAGGVLDLLGERTPSTFYPPFLYLAAAPFYALSGDLDYKTAQLSVSFFTVILIISSYCVALRAFGYGAAALCAFLVATNPAIAGSSVGFYADVPVAALAVATIALLQASREFRVPVYALASGVTLGLGMLTKQSFWIFVAPVWMLEAWSPLWRLSRPPAVRLRAALLIVVLPAALLVATIAVLCKSASPGAIAVPILSLAVWTGAAVFCWPRLMFTPGSRAAASERRRVSLMFAALWTAFLISGWWLSQNLAHFAGAADGIVPGSARIVQDITGISGRAGLVAAQAYLYAAHLLHVMLPLPVALSACGVLVTICLSRKRRDPAFALALGMVAAFIMLSIAPIYRNGYVYPIVAMAVILASGVVRARAVVARPMVLLLLLFGSLQICGEWGLLGRWSGGQHAQAGKLPIVPDSLTSSALLLYWREPDETPTDVRQLVDDLAALKPSECPVLCVLPSAMSPGFWYHVTRYKLEDRVYLALAEPPGMVRRKIASTAFEFEDIPVAQVRFGSVLASSTCVISPEGAISASTPFVPCSQPPIGALQPVRGYEISSEGHFDMLRMYRVRTISPAGN